jgi:hypothetical protein
VSAVDFPELERLARGRPGDPHLAAARAVLATLSREFPAAGLAVTGSVARLAHRPDSDVDLVTADAGFARDGQFALVHGGVRVVVVALRPGMTPERERRWPMLASGDAAVVSMVRGARVVRDPAGAFAELRETVRRTDAIRRERQGELRARYRADVDGVLRQLRGAPAPRPAVLVSLLALLLDAACLEHGVVRESKALRMMEMLRERDPALHAVLAAALPVSARSLDALERGAEMLLEIGGDERPRPGEG